MREPNLKIPPGKNTVFVALPVKYAKDLRPETDFCLNEFLKKNADPLWPDWFSVAKNVGINTVYATNDLCREFMDEWPECQWCFLFADDLVCRPEDVRELLRAASEVGADVIGGLVVTKRKREQNPDDVPFVISGDFLNDQGLVKFMERGDGVKDADVIGGTVRRHDFVAGGCALFSRRALEALRPEHNDGLAYFTADRMTPAYDVRIFQRLKEKGMTVYQHFGVTLGHVGLDHQNPNLAKVYTYWDLPHVTDFSEMTWRLMNLNRQVLTETT